MRVLETWARRLHGVCNGRPCLCMAFMVALLPKGDTQPVGGGVSVSCSTRGTLAPKPICFRDAHWSEDI